jgi:hypothetical protein
VGDSYWRAAEIRLFAGNKINCVRCCNGQCEIAVVGEGKTFRGKLLYRNREMPQLKKHLHFLSPINTHKKNRNKFVPFRSSEDFCMWADGGRLGN